MSEATTIESARRESIAVHSANIFATAEELLVGLRFRLGREPSGAECQIVGLQAGQVAAASARIAAGRVYSRAIEPSLEATLVSCWGSKHASDIMSRLGLRSI